MMRLSALRASVQRLKKRFAPKRAKNVGWFLKRHVAEHSKSYNLCPSKWMRSLTIAIRIDFIDGASNIVELHVTTPRGPSSRSHTA